MAVAFLTKYGVINDSEQGIDSLCKIGVYNGFPAAAVGGVTAVGGGMPIYLIRKLSQRYRNKRHQDE